MVRIREIKPKEVYTSVRLGLEAVIFLRKVKELNHLDGLSSAVLYIKELNIRHMDKIAELKQEVEMYRGLVRQEEFRQADKDKDIA
jgi:hypothetical protein